MLEALMSTRSTEEATPKGSPRSRCALDSESMGLTRAAAKLNYLHGGLSSTRGYHLVNVILHSICCLLLGELIGRLNFAGAQFCSPTGQKRKPKSTLALQVVTILIFGVQPVHTEAVTSIVGRADVLCGVFYLLSLLFFVDSCEDDEKAHWLGRDEEDLDGRRRQEPTGAHEFSAMASAGEALSDNCALPVTAADVIRRRVRAQQSAKVKLWLSMWLAVFALLSKEQGLTVLGVVMLYRLRMLLARRRRSIGKWRASPAGLEAARGQRNSSPGVASPEPNRCVQD
ncbi:transmembrane and TPR repeat-containing protein 1-like [Tropilaelaps mercedesae]|uniref:Transmembrane and TPR repeat-containing protein 1-like n=1 Tax=Tropilaelaps mercedesae TaxID=418985 RepID=A0A1V9WZ12_9ACAR|nr:transmembrane and TPR repeat-containing protein 1-like [Tropilaelaps mercedesae]